MFTPCPHKWLCGRGDLHLSYIDPPKLPPRPGGATHASFSIGCRAGSHHRVPRTLLVTAAISECFRGQCTPHNRRLGNLVRNCVDLVRACTRRLPRATL